MGIGVSGLPNLDSMIERQLLRGLRVAAGRKSFDPLEIAQTVFPWEWAPYQKEMLMLLLSDAWRRLVILAPPRHRKTSCVALWIALEIGRNPHLRVLVASHTRDYSALLLSQVEEIMKTPIYRRTFGDLLPASCYEGRVSGEQLQTSRWTTYERHLPNRPVYIKDPTFLALSPDSGTPGFGADIIVCDDLVSQANSSSPTKRRHIEHWFKASLLKRLEPEGRCLVVGARFYKEDLYGVLLKEGWDHKIYRASPEQPLWPAVWPSEALEQKQREDPLFFPAQFLQDPQDVEGGELDPAWFQFYLSAPPVTEMAIFGGVDMAITESTGSNFAYAVVGRTASGQVLLLDVFTRRLPGHQVLQAINTMQAAWEPIAIAWESNGAQQTVMEMLMKNPELRPGTNLVGVPSLTSKYLRLTSIAGYARVGKILLPGRLNPAGELEPTEEAQMVLDAWSKFPGGNVDLLDAFEKAVSLALQGPPPAVGREIEGRKPKQPILRRPLEPAFGRVFRSRGYAELPPSE